MIVVTGADSRFRELVEFSTERHDRLGYTVVIWDLGGLGFGVPYPHWQTADTSGFASLKDKRARLAHLRARREKPRMMLAGLKRVKQRCVWMDADSFFLQRVDELETNDWDVALINRNPSSPRLDTAALFMNYTPQTLALLGQWADGVDYDHTHKIRTDENDHYKLREILKGRGVTFTLEMWDNRILKDNTGMRIKFLTTNYMYRIIYDRIEEDLPPDTKAIHFHGYRHSKLERLQDWIDKYEQSNRNLVR